MTPLPHVHPALHIGNDADARSLLRTVRRGLSASDWTKEPADGWSIVHAAKSPWHTDILEYYHGPAPEGHPERWWAVREGRTYLNLVDSPQQLPTLVLPILDHAVTWITKEVDKGNSILVHCNMGLSRSPAVVLWWMHRAVPEQPYEEALAELLSDHPYAKQDSGIMSLVRENWGGVIAPPPPGSEVE